MENILIVIATTTVVSIILIVTSIVIVKHNQNKKYKKELNDLDITKNGVVNVSVLTEISKVRDLVKTDNLRAKLENWDQTFNQIKDKDLNKVTDMISEADYLVERKDYKGAIKKISNVELELSLLKKRADKLLNEIRIITESEERNRAIITKLKVNYRELQTKFERTIKEYGEVAEPIQKRFEEIDVEFQKFEQAMDKNDYVEVEKQVAIITDCIDEMKKLLEDIPEIVVMATVVIPGRYNEASVQYSRMVRDGYPLDYLNVEYNLKEINSKVEKIIDELKELKLGDAQLLLKTIVDYLDSLLNDFDRELISRFKEKNIPYLIAYNKNDLKERKELADNEISVSAENGAGIEELKHRLGELIPKADNKRLLGDLINGGDTVVLVIPIDKAAPKGRIILPQQQALRDILDSGAVAVVCRDTELKETLEGLKTKPKMVVTDSQAFAVAAKDTPQDVMLTSFSILMARYKGLLDSAVDGVCAIDRLKDGDTVLISEGCTHHRQCEDIGTVKIPKLLRRHTGKNIGIETSSGGGFPEDLTKYSLIIHCGGCMINGREMTSRVKRAADAGVPITNYGTAIAYMTGILKRSLAPFPSLAEKINAGSDN